MHMRPKSQFDKKFSTCEFCKKQSNIFIERKCPDCFKKWAEDIIKQLEAIK
jgi:hypothetical protein